MAVNGEVTLTWGDGEHKFNVAKLRCVLELEEKCNAGFAEIYKRLAGGNWYFNDIRETLRLGLIGGGHDPDKALTLINRYCDDRPFAENILHAQAIIMAAMMGIPDDNMTEKKTQAQEGKNPDDPSTETANSSGLSSTDLEPPSDSRRVN